MTVYKPKEPPASVTERLSKARELFLATLEKGQEPDFRALSRLIPEIRQALLETFDNRCGYCNSHVGVVDVGSLDHFYPKYLFPERAFDWENMMLSCQVCNVAKGRRFPLDAANAPLLFNPRTDDPDEHFKLRQDGTLEGLSVKGTTSVDTLHLNRAALVESRRRELLYRKLAEQRPELRSALLEDGCHARFVESIRAARSLNAITGLAASAEKSMRYMLYANIITALETYLGDALIATTKSRRPYMRKFVETFQPFKEMKCGLNEVFAKHETIDEIAIKAMADILYHDLAKVKGVYKDALGITFPPDIGALYRAVSVRHDIVHRNGRNRDGDFHSLSSEAVDELAERVTTFVSAVHEQVNLIWESQPEDEGEGRHSPTSLF